MTLAKMLDLAIDETVVLLTPSLHIPIENPTKCGGGAAE